MARILIVDDEEMERLLGRTALEGAGHQLLFAPNGEVALRTYQNHDIDLVITDLTMPDMNGMLLIEQIMAENNHALIIAVSGVSPEQLELAESIGANRTLQKPYGASELLEAVTQTLDSTSEPPPGDLWQ
jgi:CheY-like chemotaxis protein